jgi:uncharacterized MAPEG superfamily protein
MSIPMWMLLGFTTWTLLLLIATVGVYRWSNILFKRVPTAAFRGDQIEGADWYKRGTRAHANCIENLPVFGAIVLALNVTGLSNPTIDALSAIIMIARIVQSLVHVCHVQTNTFVSVRFSFYTVQLVSFLILIAMIF